ncbi:kinase-like domain-containing protein [Gilbertella persicaria]|uniref:kinase-like domain-containing protein n=1 Tax=Gilbertella persicaria TaxID=101096 RepID=UPI00221F6519|nr:kinase-like domain-containing protein [Gilbertella persicaria]KAI8059038.1 kinase-like domain-containing protein [Gilbertella persicaria]
MSPCSATTTSSSFRNSHVILEEEPSSPTTYIIQPPKSGAFRKINSQADLPMAHHQRLREGKRYGPLYMLTIELKSTYSSCSDGFKYNATSNPRRVLTKPSKACRNDGYDNEDFDYVLYVNDILGSTEGHKYLILDVLGAGTFGQVVKCRNTKTQEVVAIKVVKNKLAYFKQSMMEVAILEMLNQRYDEHDKHHLLRLRDTFIHKKHLCLVFELLSVNLYELIKQNHFRGLSTNLVRVFTAQILDALTVLNEARIIHCDLKPENILLKNLESPTLKVIDFGSACHEVQTMYTYIQSRFYRSPEVLIGLPYTSAIDMWSLGCIAAELFLGLPLFPGSSEYNQLSRIIEMLGTPPNYMIEVGKNAHRYFDRDTSTGEKRYEFKSMEQYAREQGKSEQPSKRYFSAKTLPDLINNYPIMRKIQMTPKEIEKEKQNRLAFIDFLQGLLNLNPIERWSPQQAKKHPFITGEKFTAPFQPPFIPRKQHHSNNLPSSNYQQPLNDNQQHSPTMLTTGYRNNTNGMPTQSYSDVYLSPAYSSLPNHYENTSHFNGQLNNTNKRSSYVPPLPSVIEPPHHLYHHNSNILDVNHTNGLYMQQSNNHAHGGNRPRASTLGTMEVPPQIQWAAMDQADGSLATEGSLYSPYYPYGQPPPQQQQQKPPYDLSHGYSDPNKSESLLLPRWNNSQRTIDLERDGDWQEEPTMFLPLTSTKSTPHNRQSHKRSNSSNVRFSDMSNHNGTRVSTSLHRFMRGHAVPHSRQDLEWDGVIHQHTTHGQIDNELDKSNNQQWKKDQPKDWMIA